MKDFDSVQGCPGLANTTLLFCITSPEGNFCDLNPGWETVIGYTTEELLGKNHHDWAHPDDAEASKKQTETILKGGETINFVNRLRCKNGEYKWLRWRATTNTACSLIFSVGQESDHFMDIEEEINQKTELLQKRLKESPFLQEELSLFKCLARLISNYLDQSITYNRAVLLSSIIGTSVDAVITINLEGTILSWNEGAEKLFGIAAKDSIGTSISRLYPKSHLSELDYIYSEVKAGRKIENFTTRRICPDGKLLDLQINISPLRNISGKIESYLSIAHDVTWMIDQQNILRESKDYLKKTQEIEDQLRIKEAAIRSSISAIALLNSDGTIIYVDDALIRDEGYASAEEVIGQNIASFAVFPDRLASIYEAVFNGIPVNRETQVRRKDGSVMDVQLTTSPVYSGKEIQHVMLFFVDITERNRSFRELTASNARFEAMIKSGVVGLWYHNAKTGESSEAIQWLSMLGYQKGDFPDHFSTWKTLCHPDDLKRAGEHLDQFIRQEIPEYKSEFRLRHKQGHYIWIESQAKVIEYDDAQKPLIIMGIHLDITERKEREITAQYNNNRIAAQYRISQLEGRSEEDIIEKAMTGEMAVKLATLNDYDLILMDINLGPEMDGIEATREIRKMSKNTHIPVIAVTGYATDQEKQSILEQGLNAHIIKPFTRQEILTLIDRVFAL